MEDVEMIVNRNHKKRTAAHQNRRQQKFMTRILVSAGIAAIAFILALLNLMHVAIAVPIILTAHTVVWYSLGRGC